MNGIPHSLWGIPCFEAAQHIRNFSPLGRPLAPSLRELAPPQAVTEGVKQRFIKPFFIEAPPATAPPRHPSPGGGLFERLKCPDKEILSGHLPCLGSLYINQHDRHVVDVGAGGSGNNQAVREVPFPG